MTVPAANIVGVNPYLNQGIPGFTSGPDQAGLETAEAVRGRQNEPEAEASAPPQPRTAVSFSQAVDLTEEVVQGILSRPSWLVSRFHNLDRAFLLGPNYV